MVCRLCVLFLSSAGAAPALAQGASTAGGYCLTDPGAPVGACKG